MKSFQINKNFKIEVWYHLDNWTLLSVGWGTFGEPSALFDTTVDKVIYLNFLCFGIGFFKTEYHTFSPLQSPEDPYQSPQRLHEPETL